MLKGSFWFRRSKKCYFKKKLLINNKMADIKKNKINKNKINKNEFCAHFTPTVTKSTISSYVTVKYHTYFTAYYEAVKLYFYFNGTSS